MVAPARFVSLTKDITTDKITATFELQSDADVEKLKAFINSEMNLKIDPIRSKDQNAFFHVLVNKLAKALTISKEKAKNLLITRYGQPELDSKGHIITWKTALTPEIVENLATPHAIASGYEEGFTIYDLYRPCHEYSKEEMSELIEGTLSELEEIGIHIEKEGKK